MVTRTATLHTTRIETHFHAVTNILETFMATRSTVFPSTREDTSIQTVISTKGPTTITLTLFLAEPDQIASHYPGRLSGGLNMSSAPTRISKYAATTVSPSNTELKAGAGKSSLDIYQTSHSQISLSVMLAHSGFMDSPVSSRTVTSSSDGGISSSYTVIDNTRVLATLAASTAALMIPSLTSASGTGSIRFTNLATPRPFSSSVRYAFTPKYLNATSKAMTISTIVGTSTLSTPSPDPSQCEEIGNFTLNVGSYSHSSFPDTKGS